MKQQKKVHRIFIDSYLPSEIYNCSDELSHRIISVLRIKDQDKLVIFNDKKDQYLCSVKTINKKIQLSLESKITNRTIPKRNVSLAVSIVSMKIMDLIIQKSVELGVNEFYPVYTKRSQYNNVQKKINHWRKIIIHSSEQCGRYELMKIHTPLSLNEYIDTNRKGSRYILHQNGTPFNYSEISQKDISFFIGPEGGFNDEELDIFKTNEWQMKRISVNILRTETACISAITLLNNYESFARHSI